FPMMTAAELEALAADIAENGLRQPIVRYQGMILDGRNRLQACAKAGVEPTFTDYEGDDDGALDFVISLNGPRRNLTAPQRAIIAARVLQKYPDRRGGNQSSKNATLVGRSIEKVATIFNVSQGYIQQARALLNEASDLAEQVESSALSLPSAYQELQGRRVQAKQKQKDTQRVAEYADAISNGEMKLEEALQRAIEQERKQKRPPSPDFA